MFARTQKSEGYWSERTVAEKGSPPQDKLCAAKRLAKSRSQKSEAGSQNGNAETVFRFSFILNSDFWILYSAFRHSFSSSELELVAVEPKSASSPREAMPLLTSVE